MVSPSCACVWALKALQNSMMLTPCCPRAGPTGGEVFALPAGTWSFTWATIFLAMCAPLDSLHLQELQIHRRGPTEDAHHDLQASLLRLHLVHHAREVGERAVDDPHTLAPGKLDPVLRPLGPRDHLLDDSLDLLLRNRRRA